MAKNTPIEWTDHTFNPWWGCLKVSPGCENCYAETFSKRTGRNIWGPAQTTDRWRTKGPWRDVLKWDRSARDRGVRERVFCASMSDFFEDHPQVSPWRSEACQILERLTNLDIQLLTKRPENVSRMVPAHWLINWPSHIWLGTSVENQAAADERIPALLSLPAQVHFLSVEPLLGPIDLEDLAYEAAGPEWAGYNPLISWCIVGGESGPKARPMKPDWARSVRNQCVFAGIPFFFKQWGEWGESMVRHGKKNTGRLLDGRTWDQMPATEQAAVLEQAALF